MGPRARSSPFPLCDSSLMAYQGEPAPILKGVHLARYPFPLPLSPSPIKPHPLFHAPPASPYRPACVVPRKSSKGNSSPFCLFVRRRVQRGKSARSALLGCLRLPDCMKIYMLVNGGYGARAVNCPRSALRPYALPVGPRLSIRGAIMGGHNAHYGARAECFEAACAARGVGSVCPPSPCPSPPEARPYGAERCPPWWRACFSPAGLRFCVLRGSRAGRSPCVAPLGQGRPMAFQFWDRFCPPVVAKAACRGSARASLRFSPAGGNDFATFGLQTEMLAVKQC